MRTVSGSNSSMPLVIAVVALCGWAAPRTAWATWPAFGRAISTAPKTQEHPAVASDGADGAIVVYFAKLEVGGRSLVEKVVTLR
jgi:hypothetical protein